MNLLVDKSRIAAVRDCTASCDTIPVWVGGILWDFWVYSMEIIYLLLLAALSKQISYLLISFSDFGYDMFLSNDLNEEPIVFYLEGWRVLVLIAEVVVSIGMAIYRDDEDKAAEEAFSTSYLWLIIGDDTTNWKSLRLLSVSPPSSSSWSSANF